MDWSKHYPEHFIPAAAGSGCTAISGKKVEWVDIGCGFGGLTCALAPLFPNELILGETRHLFADKTSKFRLMPGLLCCHAGMEIRLKVTQYVHDKIVELRKAEPGQYQNVSVIR